MSKKKEVKKACYKCQLQEICNINSHKEAIMISVYNVTRDENDILDANAHSIMFDRLNSIAEFCIFYRTI